MHFPCLQSQERLSNLELPINSMGVSSTMSQAQPTKISSHSHVKRQNSLVLQHLSIPLNLLSTVTAYVLQVTG